MSAFPSFLARRKPTVKPEPLVAPSSEPTAERPYLCTIRIGTKQTPILEQTLALSEAELVQLFRGVVKTERE